MVLRKEKEAIERQVQQTTQSTQAYKLFSEDKTPEEVAIALDLRQLQLVEFYTEHLKLKGLYMLDQIYVEIRLQQNKVQAKKIGSVFEQQDDLQDIKKALS